MPKETISAGDVFEIKVGWQREQGAQLGVETAGERSLFWQLLEGNLAKLGREVRALNAVVYDDDEAVGRALLNTLDVVCVMEYKGVWADLTRHGCNELIRVVRRARDQAFGRDE